MQIDTLHVNVLPGCTIYHFNAWDAVLRWTVAHAYSRASSRCAADFLAQLQAQCPFPVRAM